jgi:hypothetical protein
MHPRKTMEKPYDDADVEKIDTALPKNSLLLSFSGCPLGQLAPRFDSTWLLMTFLPSI